MPESVTFSYNGANHIAASIDNSIEAVTYQFYSAHSSLPTVVGTGGTVMLDVTDLAVGVDDNATVIVGVQRTDAAIGGVPFVAVSVVEVGTPSGPFPFTVTWHWDGLKTVTALFTALGGVEYFLRVNALQAAGPGWEQGSDDQTGTGVPLTMTVNLANNATKVEADLLLASAPDNGDGAKSSRVFLTSGAGVQASFRASITWTNQGPGRLVLA